MITISLCMIVKNEEDTLARCLDSVRGVVDEIVIVDTGSTDRTKEVAGTYTDKIFDFVWIDDFSAARNYSYSQATMDYILWLDADDVLLPEDRVKFLNLKETLNPSVDAVMIGGGGTIDIARVATFSLTSYGAKETSLLSVPYTFVNRAHFWKFAASDLGTQILNEPEKVGLGIQGLFYAEEGFRHFFFKDPVTGIQDLAGKKIRVSNDPTMTGMVQGLGASPTVVSFTELYTSLSSGVVDGAEQPIANYKSNAFNEVAPYMILDGHTLGCAEVIVTDAAWGKLTDAQKAAIQEAGKYASDFNANLSEKNENDCIDALKAAGVTFIQVTDIQAWKDACKDIIAQCTQGMETEYQAICDMAK